MAAGERLRYEPSALVYHPVPANRIPKDYFLGWWFDYGRALVREWGRGPDVWGIPRPYLNILAIGMKTMVTTMRRWMLASNSQRRFYWKCWVWVAAGEIAEFYRFARCKRPNEATRCPRIMQSATAPGDSPNQLSIPTDTTYL